VAVGVSAQILEGCQSGPVGCLLFRLGLQGYQMGSAGCQMLVCRVPNVVCRVPDAGLQGAPYNLGLHGLYLID